MESWIEKKNAKGKIRNQKLQGKNFGPEGFRLKKRNKQTVKKIKVKKVFKCTEFTSITFKIIKLKFCLNILRKNIFRFKKINVVKNLELNQKYWKKCEVPNSDSNKSALSEQYPPLATRP